MGDQTTKLYLHRVNEMVEKHLNAPPSPPSPPAPRAPAAPPKWEITGDLMHQKWGSVLRTLQPGATNGTGIMGLATGHTHAMGKAPTGATPRWDAAQLRVREARGAR